MRFRFSILTMLFWTSLLGLTLAICLAIPSMKHDIGYLVGILPRPKGIPRPEFDEVAERFVFLVSLEVGVYLTAKILARGILALDIAIRCPDPKLPDDLRKI